MIIRDTDLKKDLSKIYELYLLVTKLNPGQIRQQTSQMRVQYVQQWIRTSQERGLTFVAVINQQIVGFVKSFTSPFKGIGHVLGEVTIIVHPSYQNIKIGLQMIEQIRRRVMNEMRHIVKIEALIHDRNIKSIQLFKKVGFQIKYQSLHKIYNLDDTLGNQVLMEFVNPNFNHSFLKVYHQYLLQLHQRNDKTVVNFQQFLKKYSFQPKL